MTMTTSQSGIKADSEVGSQSQNIVETAQYFIKKTASLNVVKTTIQPNGQIIDWIPIESQEEIASPPPLPALHSNRSTDIKDDSESWKTNRPIFLLEQEGSEKGPGGAVPILRQDLNLISGKQTLAQRLTKPPFPPGKKEDRSAWPHWYASTGQSVNNLGTNGGISCYKAAVQNPADFSLLQTAIIKNNVPMPGNPYASCVQTVEVGWINYPAQVAEPHLFTFFNTNGYTEMSDYKEGWNTDVKGWVQYDNTIFPGTVLTPLCVDDGSQTELPIQVQLHQGNCNNVDDPAQTLAQGSDQINWCGEIYQTDVELTTTDMGSGQWPSTGWTHSAFINKTFYIDTTRTAQSFDGSQLENVSDTARYNMETHFNSGSNWGSYMWIGGPGADGKVGA